MLRGRGGQLLQNYLAKLIIAVLILLILIGVYMILTGKASAAIDYMKNLFNFGGRV